MENIDAFGDQCPDVQNLICVELFKSKKPKKLSWVNGLPKEFAFTLQTWFNMQLVCKRWKQITNEKIMFSFGKNAALMRAIDRNLYESVVSLLSKKHINPWKYNAKAIDLAMEKDAYFIFRLLVKIEPQITFERQLIDELTIKALRQGPLWFDQLYCSLQIKDLDFSCVARGKIRFTEGYEKAFCLIWATMKNDEERKILLYRQRGPGFNDLDFNIFLKYKENRRIFENIQFFFAIEEPTVYRFLWKDINLLRRVTSDQFYELLMNSNEFVDYIVKNHMSSVIPNYDEFIDHALKNGYYCKVIKLNRHPKVSLNAEQNAIIKKIKSHTFECLDYMTNNSHESKCFKHIHKMEQ